MGETTTIPRSATATTAARAGDSTAIVTSVTDGDTLRILVGGVEERLRLIGINAPEAGECFSDRSADALAALVEGEGLRLERDESDRDRFGRLLRYVHVDDVFVNERLVEEGFAIARRYPPDTARADRLDDAQERAESERRGLWAPDACGATAEGRITIGEIRFDADGPDNENLADEWVELRNEGSSPVDLGGWQIKDESATHRYDVPGGFTLGAGTTVRLHTGCGADTRTDLYWCNEGSAIWNNDGDTVFVLDPAGNVVASESYSGS